MYRSRGDSTFGERFLAWDASLAGMDPFGARRGRIQEPLLSGDSRGVHLRLSFLIIWIARPAHVAAVFDTFILPLPGLIFLPFATLIWVLLDAPPGGVEGFDGSGSSWQLMDLSHYVGAYTQRGRHSGSPAAA